MTNGGDHGSPSTKPATATTEESVPKKTKDDQAVKVGQPKV